MVTPLEFVTSDLDFAAAIITNNTLEFVAIRTAPNNREKVFVFRDPDSIGAQQLGEFIAGRVEGSFTKFVQTKAQLLSVVRKLGVHDELTFTR